MSKDIELKDQLEEKSEISSEQASNAQVESGLSKLLLIILGAVTLYAYQYPLLRTYDSWSSKHGYNPNGLWIFLGCLALMFFALKKVRHLPKNIEYKGLVCIVMAVIWSLAFKRGDINAMQTIGFIGLVWSVFLYLGGWSVAKAVMFPLFLSLFTVQWGLGTTIVSLNMRVISTQFACWLINLTGAPFGIEVLRQGTNVSMVNIPELAFDVAAACSGLQSLVMTSVLCLLMAHLVLKTWWKRIAMVSLIIPIAIFNNSLRIVLIAYFGSFFTWIEHTFNLTQGWGARTAYGSFHEYPGVVVYTLGFAMVWLASYVLERVPGVERDELLARKAKKKAPEATKEAPPAKVEIAIPTRKPYLIHIVVVLIIVSLMALVGNVAVKSNVYYTKGLASVAARPTLVSGGKSVIQALPYITGMPSRVSGYVKIEIPVSTAELIELPEDTEYFRGLYVTTNNYLFYNKVMQKILTMAKGDLSNRINKILAMPVDTPLPTNLVSSLVHMGEYYRTNYYLINIFGKSAPERQQIMNSRSIIYKLLLSKLAQRHRANQNVMMAIVQNQTDRHSIHAPEACYPGQGWTIGEAKLIEIEHTGSRIEAARMDVGFKQENIKETVLYWYQSEGKGDQEVYATCKYLWLPFKTAMDLIFNRRSDRWAFVRFSTGVDVTSSYDESSFRLQEFVKKMESYLNYRGQ